MTLMPSAEQQNKYQAWIDSLLKKGTGNKQAIVQKQRCLNLGGKDLLCVQDKAKVNPWVVGGVLVVLYMLVRR